MGRLEPGRVGRPPGLWLETLMGRSSVKVALLFASLACSTPLDGRSSSSIASGNIADSRSSGTVRGEAFSATHSTRHGKAACRQQSVAQGGIGAHGVSHT